MKSVVRLLTVVSLTLVVLLITFYLFVPRILQPKVLESRIAEFLQSESGIQFQYETADVRYFPNVTVTFERAVLESSEGNRLTAPDFSLRLKFWDLFVGKINIAVIKVSAAEIDILQLPKSSPLRQIHLKNLQAVVKPHTKKQIAQVLFNGDWGNSPQSVSGEIIVRIDKLEEFDWKTAPVKGKIQFTAVSLEEWMGNARFQFPYKIRSGHLSADLSFEQNIVQGGTLFTGSLKIVNFVYEAVKNGAAWASPETNAHWDFELFWEPQLERLSLNRNVFVSPAATLEMNGRVILSTGEIPDMRISAPQIVLESIPQYWPAFENAIPFNIGFSGLGALDISLKGTWDHLTIDANADFAKSLLTYGRYFQKPKEIPMTVSVDFLLKNGRLLSGDFSTHLRSITLKGTVKSLDLSTSESQINFITNKFKLSDWEGLLLPFENYDMQGEMKVLVNLEGRLDTPDSFRRMLNLTVENGYLARKKSGPVIRDIALALDEGKLSFDVKNAEFKVGDSAVKIEFSVYTPKQNPMAKFKILSPEIEPRMVLNTIQDMLLEWLPPSAANNLENLRQFTGSLFAPEDKVKNFSAELDSQQGQWRLHELKFESYGGILTLTGNLDLNPPLGTYQADLVWENFQLEEFSRRSFGTPVLEGEAVLKMNLTGEKLGYPDWLDAAQGSGGLEIRSGKFKTFNLLRTVSGLGLLKKDFEVTEGTAFDEFSSEFVLKNGKIIFDKIRMMNPEILAHAGGELSLEGNLNSQWNVFLSPEIVREDILRSKHSRLAPDGSLGPLPFFLTGAFTQPDLRVNSQTVSDWLEHLR